jgi:hypothetical protein
MQLPFEVDDRHVLRFIAYWESLHVSPPDLPVWDMGAVQRVLPDLLPNIAVIEVRDPQTLFIHRAGKAFRDHYGFEITGTDLLRYTQPEDIAERYRRFHTMAATPCGALFQAPVLGAYNISIIGDVIWLPVREQASGKILLVTLHGLGGQKVYDERPASIMPLARKFAFVDIGFGAPPPPKAPGTWSTVKAAITRHLHTLLALVT